jgi:hypothetical protein
LEQVCLSDLHLCSTLDIPPFLPLWSHHIHKSYPVRVRAHKRLQEYMTESDEFVCAVARGRSTGKSRCSRTRRLRSRSRHCPNLRDASSIHYTPPPCLRATQYVLCPCMTFVLSLSSVNDCMPISQARKKCVCFLGNGVVRSIEVNRVRLTRCKKPGCTCYSFMPACSLVSALPCF